MQERLVAGIDLGANSFHMVVARLMDQELVPIDSIAEKVQLIAGVDEHRVLSEEAILRGLSCLQRFKERIKNIPADSVRIVGTSTLRISKNSKAFITRAEQLLGLPIAVVSGHEEARLIYLGIAHTQKSETGKRLVIDIGGGSTEFIIGEGFTIKDLASKHIGCVSYKERFLSEDTCPATGMHAMVQASRLALLDIQNRFLQQGWSTCMGCSGAIRSVSGLLRDNFSASAITLPALYQLKAALLRKQAMNFTCINTDRRSLLLPSLAILLAIFETFKIKQMQLADGALREGLIYDMLGRRQHEDVRQRTIHQLMRRYKVDTLQAQRVTQQALYFYKQVNKDWHIDQPEFYDMLHWAASVYEIGLAIAHSKYQKHSAYILKYSDLPGFSEDERQYLSTLVRLHRKTITREALQQISKEKRKYYKRLTIILRLAVLLHRSRDGDTNIPGDLTVCNKHIHLAFGANWLSKHPLTSASLANEAGSIAAIGYVLEFE